MCTKLRLSQDRETSVKQRTVHIQLAKINMAVLFWHLVKRDASLLYCTVRTLDKSRFTRYQDNTAMYNWSTVVSPIWTLDFFFMPYHRVRISESSNAV